MCAACSSTLLTNSIARARAEVGVAAFDGSGVVPRLVNVMHKRDGSAQLNAGIALPRLAQNRASCCCCCLLFVSASLFRLDSRVLGCRVSTVSVSDVCRSVRSEQSASDSRHARHRADVQPQRKDDPGGENAVTTRIDYGLQGCVVIISLFCCGLCI